jgi:hypothetical protein
MKTLALIIAIISSQIDEIKFQKLIQDGTVVLNEDNEYDSIEPDTYTIHLDDNKVIEYAYKGEVKEWIRTGKFEYNDFLID